MKVGSFVLRNGRPELGVGEVLEVLAEGYLRVGFPHAEGGAHALSEDEARGRMFATD